VDLVSLNGNPGLWYRRPGNVRFRFLGELLYAPGLLRFVFDTPSEIAIERVRYLCRYPWFLLLSLDVGVSLMGSVSGQWWIVVLRP
jgi:hypothetical protein